jgi:hypothetical protein
MTLKDKNMKYVRTRTMNKLIQKYLKQNSLRDYAHAENENHHSLCALIEAEKHLKGYDNKPYVQRYAASLYDISSDLCAIDYDGLNVSETVRQLLIKERGQAEHRLLESLSDNYCPF